MRVAVAISIVLAGWLTSAPGHAEDAPVALIAVAESGSAATLFESLRVPLESAGHRVLSARALATALGDDAEPAPGQAAVDAARAAIAAAERAFLASEFEVALTALDRAAQRLAEVPWAGFPERIELALWRAGVEEARGQAAAAQRAARQALALDPTLVVDLGRFWPRLAALVAAERDAVTPLEITVTGVPAGATLWVDGRAVDSSFVVGAGEHVLAAQAGGYRPVATRRTLTAAGEWALSLAMALGAHERAAAAALWAGARPAPVCAAAGVTVCVLAGAREDGVRAVVSGATVVRSPVFARTDAGRAALAEWVDAALTTSAQAPEPSAAAISVHARVFPFVFKSSELTWIDSEVDLGAEGSGVGVRAALAEEARRSAWYGAVELRLWQLFESRAEGSNVDLALPSNVGGTSVIAGAAEFGRRFAVRGGRLSVTPLALMSGRYEAVSDLRQGSSEVGLFSSQSFVTVAAGVAVDARLSAAWGARADASVDVLGVYLKRPTGVGDAGTPGSLRTGLRVRWSPTARLGVYAEAEFRRTQVEFSGLGDAAVAPAPRDARRVDTEGGIVLGLMWQLGGEG